MGESVKKIVLYNAETGEQLELNGAQEISLAEEALTKDWNEKIPDFDREFVAEFTNLDIDPMLGLRLRLALETWEGKVPRVRINKARWPWRI